MGLSTSNAGVDAGRLAFDTQGLASLKGAATSGGERQQQALEESARQFEALMLNMMLKQMRSATESSALTGSQQQEMMTAMLDQQLSQQLASVGEGMGLSRILIQQLSSRAGTAGGDYPPETSSSESAHALASDLVAKEVGAAQGGADANWLSAVEAEGADSPGGFMAMLEVVSAGREVQGLYAEIPQEAVGAGAERLSQGHQTARSAADVSMLNAHQRQQPDNVQRFVAEFAPAARAASRESGLPAELILAQAALETGWGERRIHTEDGQDSHNLFGIKAGSGWQGDSTTVLTTEYREGRRLQLEDSFRVYPDQASALRDHAALLSGADRYAHVARSPDAQSAARALQSAGYATDPHYAEKLISIMQRVGPLDASGDRELSSPRLASRDVLPSSEVERSLSGTSTASASQDNQEPGWLAASAPLWQRDAGEARPLFADDTAMPVTAPAATPSQSGAIPLAMTTSRGLLE
ncbi:flagellar assembly peptidoglycan hydrolase FlgJ [Cobetia sp. 5-25-4-2]|uniref:flagellar assembly peptidoglycan hydrolase FlgJ n=1 Tax=Cobetia sp. 5-25-4-2 TaxID=2737459 RepID=UPI001596D5E8|nr:flagellar assembly peptidoglycan hydrolase FlgJ [Cobetia sp. 5-25-4-2]